MSYFVTGATGFIGRNLVELLLEREGTIYVLVREGSKGRLELRNRWGADDSRVVGIVGDLSEPRLGISDADLERLKGEIDHLFHLAAIYDMTADAESQRVANVEGTRHMVEFAEVVEAGRVHMVSSIAAAGLYRGTWREDMFDEAQDLDTHAYFRTKHESEGVVRTECERPWRVYRPGIVVGNSETGEMDKVDGPYYFFKLIRRIRNAVPQWMPMPGVEASARSLVPVDFVVRAMDHIAHLDDLDGRAFHLTDPNPPTAGEVIDIFARAAHAPQSSVRVPAGASRRWSRSCGWRSRRRRSGDAVADRILADFIRGRCSSTSTTRPTSTPGRPRWRCRAPTSPCRRWSLRRQALGLLGAPSRSGPFPRPDPDGRGSRPARTDRRHRPGDRAADTRRADAARAAAAGVHLAREGGSRRVVMVTGASSGIGKSAALKIAAAGGTVLLVARTPEKLEQTKEQIEAEGASPTSTAPTSPTPRTSTAWPTRRSPSTATSTS